MANPVRVLHVLQRMEAAGVQTLLMSLYREIDRDKVQFDFLVHYKTPQLFDEEVEKFGGKIYRLSVREDYNFVRYWQELNKLFKEHPEYKVVHGHMHSLGAIYLKAAQNNGVRTRIAHSHTDASGDGVKRYIKSFMNKKYAKYATDLFACSDAAGQYMFGEKPFCVINNAIIADNFIFSKEKRYAKRKELGIDDQLVIGAVGRFVTQKNHKFSVNVFEEIHKRNTNSMLLLIGAGDLMAEVKALVKSKGMEDCVLFLSNRRDMAELYQSMDVFLMPSLHEGLGIVGVEAQAAGTPTVCTDTLPKEIDVSSLIYRVPLSENVGVWADRIEEAASNKEAHLNMKGYIAAANYDMATLAKKLQEYYMSKY